MKCRRKRKRVWIFWIVAIQMIIIIYYFFIVLPVVKTYSYMEVVAETERAVNNAVSNVINRSLSYDALIDINYSTEGEIVSFSANQFEINSMTREIVKETQHQMDSLGKYGLNINLGTFSGVPFLLGKGKMINIRLVPIGAVSGNFSSEFTSVGINMTKHTLFLCVSVRVSIALPIKAYEVESINQVLLAESIIMGKVPEVYLNGGTLGKSLNLVP